MLVNVKLHDKDVYVARLSTQEDQNANKDKETCIANRLLTYAKFVQR